MVFAGSSTKWIMGGLLCLPALASQIAVAQQPSAHLVESGLVESGSVTLGGHETPYRIRHLPISSFPEIPTEIATELVQRGCLIPQTFEARQPENVVHASLERPGSSDWAVLCSTKGIVSLLVFFGSASVEPLKLASAPETQRLQQHMASSTLGFNWGIDPASPQTIRQAQSAMEHHPPLLDHDALADSVVDRSVVYHFYRKGEWTTVEMPEE